MDISSQIERIRSAKTALVAWLIGKNITVPEGTLLDGAVALLDDVEVGGGAATDDGEGNITIDSLFSYAYADDGEGNITVTVVAGRKAADIDGNIYIGGAENGE